MFNKMVCLMGSNAFDGSKYTAKVDSLLSNHVHVSVTKFVTASMALCFCLNQISCKQSMSVSYSF